MTLLWRLDPATEGDGAAVIKCKDKNCPCQATDKREPLPGQPEKASRKRSE